MSRYQHVLLGGLFIGVVSALPVVGSANVCCCLWVVTGGVLSTYLLQQNRADPIESGEAAVGGLLAGLLGALIHIVLQLAAVQRRGRRRRGAAPGRARTQPGDGTRDARVHGAHERPRAT